MGVMTLLLSITVSAQLAPSADPRPMPIAGVIVDPAVKPAPDVAVWLLDGLSPGEFRRFGDEFLMEPFNKPGTGLPVMNLETRTDSMGKFVLELPAEFAARRWQSPLVLLAIKPGMRVAIRRLPVPPSLVRSPVSMAVQAAVGTAFRVLDPDGKPVGGAKVSPCEIDDVPIPGVLGRQIGGTSDSQGRLVLTSVPRSLLQEVTIETPGFGRQRIRIDREQAVDLRIAPVGRLVGRLVAPANDPIRGVTVRAATLVDGFEGSGQGGMAEVACDASGRFEIPALAAGMLTLGLIFDPRTGTRLRTEPYHGIVLAAGTTTELAIPLRPTVRITGSFREQGSSRPISGVLVRLNGMFGGDHFAVTYAGGQYQGFIARENFQAYGWQVRIPGPFFEPTVLKDIPQRMPPPGTDVLVMPPIELPRGVDVPGSVVDAAGHGVAGATVEATWRHGTGRIQLVMSSSDSLGRFVLRGVDPVAELTYRAWLGDSWTPGATIAQAAAALTKPVVLTITPTASSLLRGRVLDTAGRPISGASVRIWRLGRGKNRRVIDIEPILSEDGHAAVPTDSDGRYRAPRRVPFPDEFFVEATAPGRLSARSFSDIVDEQGKELPTVTLRRVRAISGQVVDRQGQPVAGARVQQAGDGPIPTGATTDDQGRFRLPGVLEGPAIVLVRKTGFQIEPHSLAGREESAKLVLTRTGEPASLVYKTLPSALPVDEEIALVRQLLHPFATRVLQQGTEDERRQLLMKLADIDPSWTLEHLASVKFTDSDDLDGVRSNIAGALLRDNADEAATVTESITQPARRALVYAGSARDLLKRDPVRARQHLDQAILNLQAASPRAQTIPARMIIELLVDLGEVERARELLKTERQRIESLYKGSQRSYALGTQVVVPLARIDATAALAEFEKLRRDVESESKNRAGTFDMLLGQIAFDLADRSPADAERLLRRVSSSAPLVRVVDDYVLAVCSRMASRDLARARSFTDLIANGEIELKPFAVGLMAKALAPSDRAAALLLIDEAYTELDQLRARGRISQFASISIVAGGLLPIVEEIDASRLPEFLARAIALRPVQGGWSEGSFIPEQNAQLAMMMARYDRKLAAQVIQPDLDRLGSLSLSAHGVDLRTRVTLCALALINPLKAVELIESLPESPTLGLRGFIPGKVDIIVDAAKLLSLHGDDRWRHVYEGYLHLWTPDQDVR
jgi:Carboxypeptidase regulatory-like domain